MDKRDIIKDKYNWTIYHSYIFFLEDKNIEQLTEAIKDIIAERKGHRVVNHSVMPHGIAMTV